MITADFNRIIAQPKRGIHGSNGAPLSSTPTSCKEAIGPVLTKPSLSRRRALAIVRQGQDKLHTRRRSRSQGRRFSPSMGATDVGGTQWNCQNSQFENYIPREYNSLYIVLKYDPTCLTSSMRMA